MQAFFFSTIFGFFVTISLQTIKKKQIMSQLHGDVTPGRHSVEFPSLRAAQRCKLHFDFVAILFFNLFGRHFSLSSSRCCALKDQKLDLSVAIGPGAAI
jgi:hypothetical protein